MHGCGTGRGMLEGSSDGARRMTQGVNVNVNRLHRVPVSAPALVNRAGAVTLGLRPAHATMPVAELPCD